MFGNTQRNMPGSGMMGGGGLGSLIGMLSGGRRFGNAESFLQKVFGGRL